MAAVMAYNVMHGVAVQVEMKAMAGNSVQCPQNGGQKLGFYAK